MDRATSLTVSFRRETKARGLVAVAMTMATIAVAGSCREPLSPPFSVRVFVADTGGPVYSTDAAGRALLTCNATLEAVGAGNGTATWLDAVVRLYAVDKPTVALDSSTFPDTLISDSWGGGVMGPDSVKRARWVFDGAIPFIVGFSFRYQVVGGREDSARATLPCRPAVPPGPAPAITALASLPSSVYEPGRTLAVGYSVTSSVGLWDDVLTISGPCDTVLYGSDSVHLAISRTRTLLLPASCNLGVPVQATVTAIDANLQASERTITLPVLVDTTPPSIETIAPFAETGTPDSVIALSGDVFVGDTILIDVAAFDNHIVQTLNWIATPVGGSGSIVKGTVGSAGAWMPIVLQPTWSGPIQLGFFARDASGNTSPVLRTWADSLVVYPSLTPPTVEATVSLPFGQMVWDTRRGVIYLNQGDWKKIGIFSRAADAVTGTLVLNDYPAALDLSPGGDSLIAALALTRSLAIVNLRTSLPTVTTVPLPVIDTTLQPSGLAVAANGEAVISAISLSGGSGHIYTYDLATGAARLRLDAGIAGATASGRIARSGDRSAVILNGGAGMFQRYDAGTDTFEPPTTARVTWASPQVDSTAAHIVVAGDVYDKTLQYVLTPRAHTYEAQREDISPDGQTMFISDANKGVVRARLSDGTTIDRLVLPVVANGMSVAPDGSTFAVIDELLSGADVIAFVNLTQLPTSPRAASASRRVAGAH